jgi:hypothetical protein
MSKLPIHESRGGMAATSRRIMLPLFTAALALAGFAMPASAQSAHRMGSGELVIQNNREVPVTVYLDAVPLERELGTVEPMRSATFSIPEHMMREGEMVELLLTPRGQLALQARVLVSEEDTQMGLVVPPTRGQEKRLEKEMLAWQMRGEPVVRVTVQDELEYELD